MSVWQRLNAPRNKREHRVAKIARDQERERIIKLLEERRNDHLGIDNWADAAELEESIALIKGENNG